MNEKTLMFCMSNVCVRWVPVNGERRKAFYQKRCRRKKVNGELRREFVGNVYGQKMREGILPDIGLIL